MPARTHATAALILLAINANIYHGDAVKCYKDGLYTDYERECREYVRCSGGAVSARYKCGVGRVFSEASGACVPAHTLPCVRRQCAPNDTLAYATPGTACRHYYRCENGTSLDRACPSGSWFDPELQACARGAGTCYEPVCGGLVDGLYPDPSHECRRAMQCRGGTLQAVRPCDLTECSRPCPPPRTAAAALPAGDADFCSDEACSSMCQSAADGAYADRSTGCREYFVCEARRVTRRGVCDAGLIFSNGGCEPVGRAVCPPPAPSPCFNRADGLHRDWRACDAWFECRRERVVARGACGAGRAFDGAGCVPRDRFYCLGPERSASCVGLPSGTYADLESNCTLYFHCEGPLRTTLRCEAGLVFDGARCTPATTYVCPSLERDSCYGRADGRYRSEGAGCRGYYTCFNGEKAIYACAPGAVFDGDSCVPVGQAQCPRDASCRGLTDGYHADKHSDCRRYFYCEGGDRLATFSCSGGKVFDGQACVEGGGCGAGSAGAAGGGRKCVKDGFFVQAGSKCSRYYFCVGGARTALSCGAGLVFNGQVCVPPQQYECPG